jgi:hypothetical protein
MRGRKPSGPAVVERLPGSPQARERLRVILETLAGTCRIAAACARLGVSEQRFDQLRTQVLQAGLDSLQPRPLGRPRQAAAATVAALQARLTAAETELAAAQVREEIALVLPAVQVTAEVREKKQPGGARRGRRAARNRVDRRGGERSATAGR